MEKDKIGITGTINSDGNDIVLSKTDKNIKWVKINEWRINLDEVQAYWPAILTIYHNATASTAPTQDYEYSIDINFKGGVVDRHNYSKEDYDLIVKTFDEYFFK